MGLRNIRRPILFAVPDHSRRGRMGAYMKKHNLTNDEISTLCLELSLLFHSGVDAGSGLFLLAEEEGSSSLGALLTQMARQVDEGGSLAGAFRDCKAFPEYVCGLIQVGEQTGRTEEALRSLARYYEDRAQLDRQLRSSLLYPAVLLLVMLAVIVVLLTQVLPVFNDVYANLGGQLTGVAGSLLALGQALDRLMPLLCLLLGLAVVLLAAFAGSFSFRSRVLTFWRSRMGDKGVSKKLNNARFAQALSMGMGSGLTMEESLELAASLLSDLPAAQRRCQDCRGRLEEGTPLAKAMAESGVLPRADCRLLDLGIRSGSGDSVMVQIAQRLSQEGEDALEARMGQIEPTLVVISSILVGLILLAVMLPLMHIMSAIG